MQKGSRMFMTCSNGHSILATAFSLRADDTCNYVALMLSYLYLTRMHSWVTWHEFSFIRCAYMEEAFSWSVVLQLISDHDWPAVSQQCHAFLFSILASQSQVCIVAVLDSYCTSIMQLHPGFHDLQLALIMLLRASLSISHQGLACLHGRIVERTRHV